MTQVRCIVLFNNLEEVKNGHPGRDAHWVVIVSSHALFFEPAQGVEKMKVWLFDWLDFSESEVKLELNVIGSSD